MAKKEKLREKRRAQRLHQKAVKEARNKSLLEDVADDEEIVEDLPVEEELDDEFEADPEEEGEMVTASRKEIVEKDGYNMASPMPEMHIPMGPTSWDELDAEHMAMEQADALSEVSWDARSLVNNILNHPMMDPQEQTKALQAVASGFGARAKSAMSMTEKSKEDDIELLELEAMIAKDNRSMSGSEKVLDFISKRVLSSQGRKNLPDSAFALPSKRKYPIHDKAHVRNALSRAAQAMKMGGEAAADAKAAMPKIRAMAKKMGIGSMEKNRNALIIEKDQQGSWRWVGFPSNNFIDLDAEIISEKAHLEYVDWVNKNMDVSPMFVTWHTPGTMREKPVDFVGYENGFLIMSGPLTEGEAGALFALQKETDLGMSHGSFALERDPNDKRVITKYRMYEVSDLPLENAANPFTEFAILTKEVGMDKLAYLSTIIGSDRAKAILEKMGEKQNELKEADVETKETQAAPETKKEEKKPEVTNFDVLWKAMEEKMDLPGLNETIAMLKEDHEKVTTLEDMIKAMNTDNDEKLAQMISAPAERRFAWSKASESDKNLLKETAEDQKLKKGVSAELGWLSEATGTQPVQQ